MRSISYKYMSIKTFILSFITYNQPVLICVRTEELKDEWTTPLQLTRGGNISLTVSIFARNIFALLTIDFFYKSMDRYIVRWFNYSYACDRYFQVDLSWQTRLSDQWGDLSRSSRCIYKISTDIYTWFIDKYKQRYV